MFNAPRHLFEFLTLDGKWFVWIFNCGLCCNRGHKKGTKFCIWSFHYHIDCEKPQHDRGTSNNISLFGHQVRFEALSLNRNRDCKFIILFQRCISHKWFGCVHYWLVKLIQNHYSFHQSPNVLKLLFLFGFSGIYR